MGLILKGVQVGGGQCLLNKGSAHPAPRLFRVSGYLVKTVALSVSKVAPPDSGASRKRPGRSGARRGGAAPARGRQVAAQARSLSGAFL